MFCDFLEGRFSSNSYNLHYKKSLNHIHLLKEEVKSIKNALKSVKN